MCYITYNISVVYKKLDHLLQKCNDICVAQILLLNCLVDSLENEKECIIDVLKCNRKRRI